MTARAGDRLPKYLRIHGELRDLIGSGRWPAGSLLPSQAELAAQFGVSIMTLRQALQLLTDDGLVQARHGSGTYVSARYDYDLGHLRSFADDLATQGAQITTRVLAAGIVTPPAEVAARLAAADGVLRLRRLRLSGGQPVIVQTSYLPADLAAAIEREDLTQRGLYAILAAHGQAVSRASETISPVALGPDDARDLGRPGAAPALLSHRVSFTAAGVPVIDDHALLPGDSIAITADRSAGHLDAHYTLTNLPARPPAANRVAGECDRFSRFARSADDSAPRPRAPAPRAPAPPANRAPRPRPPAPRAPRPRKPSICRIPGAPLGVPDYCGYLPTQTGWVNTHNN